MARCWRLLVDGSASGPFNMGVDEVLLETALREGRPSVRFYTWQGPWLSLGYQQHRHVEKNQAQPIAGIGVVRRSTGGRAVLHGCDLTYCVAAPASLLPDGLQPTYALIAVAVSEALRSLGVPVERIVDPPVARSDSEFDCFAASATDELCVDGRKLVGSAQRRVTGGLLQHGSIRVMPDPLHVRAAVGFGNGVATSLAELGCPVGFGELLGACIRSFEEVLGVQFERAGLSDREWRRARARGSNPPPALRAVEHGSKGDPRLSVSEPARAISRADRRPAGKAAPQ